MLNFNLREVSPGEAIRAEDWNALVSLLRELTSESNARELSVGEGLELHKSSSGSTLLLDVGDFRDEAEPAEPYEHPFKVTAARTTNAAGEDIVRVHVARGAWTNSSRINSNNSANHAVEIPAGDYDVTAAGASVFAVKFVCPLARVGADEGPHFLIPEYGSECSITTDPSAVSGWVIDLAIVRADATRKTVSVEQLWRSDIVIPDILATIN